MERFGLAALGGVQAGVRGGGASWQAVPFGSLRLPAFSQGAYAEGFWLSRHREYNRLSWNELDWRGIREQLGHVAEGLAVSGPQVEPELSFVAEGLPERTFLEMWFGYGEPSPVRVDGDMAMGYGQHRLCALANLPMCEEDRALMSLGPEGFGGLDVLSADALVPVLVDRRRVAGISLMDDAALTSPDDGDDPIFPKAA